MGFIHLLLLGFLYSCIWLVPISMMATRRKKGLKPYWLLLGVTLGLEIAIIYAGLTLIADFNDIVWLLYLPGIVASVGASLFYLQVAKGLDHARN